MVGNSDKIKGKIEIKMNIYLFMAIYLYETEIEGELIIEKNIVAYIAYVEENGQLVPRVRFED